MEDTHKTWLEYNEHLNRIAGILGGTSNIVGEYAEFLVCQCLGGKRLKASNKSADVEGPDGKKYQVKARRVGDNLSTQLGVIRSWDFDYLVIIFFDMNGSIKRASEVPVSMAKEYAVINQYQNGSVITTHRGFFDDPRCRDISSLIFGVLPVENLPAVVGVSDISVVSKVQSIDVNMKKRDILRAADVASKKGVHIANENKALPVWWLDISESEIESRDLDLIVFVLVDRRESLLHVLEIPVDFICTHVDRLRLLRKKTGNFRSFHLSVEEKNKFQNVVPIDSGLNFSQFLKKSISFVGAA